MWACTSVDTRLFLSRFPFLVTISVEIASLSGGHWRQQEHIGESANSAGNNSDSEGRKRNNKQVVKNRKSEQKNS